ncbi:MAG: periplasmic heavy metal sensor [Ignavibacteria bacterium]|nr:periplasmic heavy metal sensor [Ignavibacteria bacterium]
MKNKLALISTLVLVILIGNLFSQPEDDFFADKKFSKRLVEKLNLTDKQKEDLAKLRAEHQKQMVDMKSEIQKLQIDLKTAWREKDLDRKKMEAITDKIAESRKKMAKLRLNHWFDVYSKLNEEQQLTFRKMSGMMMEKLRMRGREFRDRFEDDFRGPRRQIRPLPPIDR